MNIREAKPDDNKGLQGLQAKCPQGTAISVSIVNTPDFFARTKAYETCKVYVACADNQIIGSAALAIREAIVNSEIMRVGYEFQYFTSPDYRRKGVAGALHKHIEDYLASQGAALSYLLIMEGNLAPQQLFESQGFRLHRTLAMPILSVYKKVDVASRGMIRAITSEDLSCVADLLDDTWQGYDLYGPTSAEVLARFVERTPAYSFDNLLVLEDQGEVLACLGFWDWSQIAQITVRTLNFQMRMTGFLVGITRYIRQVPRVPKPGTILKQWCLTPIGFRDPEHLTPLMRYINNQAMERGIEQIFCLCERRHALLDCMKGLFHREVAMYLYIKPFQKIFIGDNPVFIDGVDL